MLEQGKGQDLERCKRDQLQSPNQRVQEASGGRALTFDTVQLSPTMEALPVGGVGGWWWHRQEGATALVYVWRTEVCGEPKSCVECLTNVWRTLGVYKKSVGFEGKSEGVGL